jgi:hypothetical protein
MTTDLDPTVDIAGIDDFDPHMPTVSGRMALLHRLGRRLTTPRGRFIYWPDFGTDLRQYLLSKTPPSRIAAATEAECVKDEQVESVDVTVSNIDYGTRTLTISCEVTDADGPFDFTLTISEAAATLVTLQET